MTYMFGAHKKSSPIEKVNSSRVSGFAYLPDKDIYVDAACQSLRPESVIQTLTDYYHTYNACGGRVKYAWGQQVDEKVDATRRELLKLLKLSPKAYAVSFTLNTTYGINLLLQQLPEGQYQRVITTDIEHNSVFLPTIALAKRLGVERIVLPRAESGAVEYSPEQLERAVVVLNAVSNIDGRMLQNINELIRDTHDCGGIVIIDAAQAMAHSYEMLQGTDADAICFSAHKMYSASLGVMVARKELLRTLAVSFVGGGMVSDVRETEYTLLDDETSVLLEPGLQAFGEIIALGEATRWLEHVKPQGVSPQEYMAQLSSQLYEGLTAMSGVTVFNKRVSPVISLTSHTMDAHQLAIYLSAAGIMARSGYFCCHYYLKETIQSPPLLRFSLGLHNTPADVDKIISVMSSLTGRG